MPTEIVMPQMGESIFEGTITKWLKKPGDTPAPVMSSAQAIALGAALFVTLAAGLYPEPFTRLAHYALGFQR